MADQHDERGERQPRQDERAKAIVKHVETYAQRGSAENGGPLFHARSNHAFVPRKKVQRTIRLLIHAGGMARPSREPSVGRRQTRTNRTPAAINAPSTDWLGASCERHHTTS